MFVTVSYNVLKTEEKEKKISGNPKRNGLVALWSTG